MPLSPTCVPYLIGRFIINSCAWAAFEALIISFKSALGFA